MNRIPTLLVACLPLWGRALGAETASGPAALDFPIRGSAPGAGRVAEPGLAPWQYRLIADARLVDDCEVCGRPTIEVPLQGTFDLVQTETNPLFSRYRVFNLRFTDGAEKPGYELLGEGSFEFGGEVALIQRWTLELEAVTPAGRRRVVLSNPDLRVTRLWPMLAVELVEAGGTPLSRLFLSLTAAPLQELWFNTAHGMTSGRGEWPDNRVSPADFLTDTGRVVREGAWLLKQVGVSGSGSAADLDAFTILEGGGGEVWFSLDREVVSETLGPIGEGDLLSSKGTVVLRNRELVEAFGLMPPASDLGLDAVAQARDGLWFSTRTTQFSERLGVAIGRGDLLSSAGRVERTHQALLAQFSPDNTTSDYGLDGFHVWPSGEIWFTTEEGFQDATRGYITDGDLLSDQGYVVARNLDLVREFQPLEDLANFGLQGVLVVSDAAAPPPAAKLRVSLGPEAVLRVFWEGGGRVYQVEATASLQVPFARLSPILLDRTWSEAVAGPPLSSRYYRVRSW